MDHFAQGNSATERGPDSALLRLPGVRLVQPDGPCAGRSDRPAPRRSCGSCHSSSDARARARRCRERDQGRAHPPGARRRIRTPRSASTSAWSGCTTLALASANGHFQIATRARLGLWMACGAAGLACAGSVSQLPARGRLRALSGTRVHVLPPQPEPIRRGSVGVKGSAGGSAQSYRDSHVNYWVVRSVSPTSAFRSHST